MVREHEINQNREIFTEVYGKLVVPDEEAKGDGSNNKLTIDLTILMPRAELDIPQNVEQTEFKTYVKYFNPDELTILITDKFKNWRDLVRYLLT